MRIDPASPNIPPVSGRRTGRIAPRTSSTVDSSEKPSDVSLPAEIVPLLASLDEVPEVRHELVEEVRQRLSRGEHLTHDAAEKTAEAILADLASFIGQ